MRQRARGAGPMSDNHREVNGGFVCDECGATRRTPLGIARHRGMCRRGSGADRGDGIETDRDDT